MRLPLLSAALLNAEYSYANGGSIGEAGFAFAGGAFGGAAGDVISGAGLSVLGETSLQGSISGAFSGAINAITTDGDLWEGFVEGAAIGVITSAAMVGLRSVANEVMQGSQAQKEMRYLLMQANDDGGRTLLEMDAFFDNQAKKAGQLLENENSLIALRKAQSQASSLMRQKGVGPNNFLAGVDPDKLRPHGTIIKKGLFGFRYETGEHVVSGNQLSYGPLGRLIETNFGGTEPIQGALAVVIVTPSRMEPDFEVITNQFSRLNQITPVFISNAGNNFVIEGNSGPIKVDF